MPREHPPHFSPRWSDTGPNLGHRFDFWPPNKCRQGYIIFLFLFMQLPLRKDQNVKKSVDLTPPNDPSFTLIQVDDHYEWGLTWKLMCQSVLFLPSFTSRLRHGLRMGHVLLPAEVFMPLFSYFFLYAVMKVNFWQPSRLVVCETWFYLFF